MTASARRTGIDPPVASSTRNGISRQPSAAEATNGRRGSQLRVTAAAISAPTARADMIAAQVVAPEKLSSATSGPTTNTAGSTVAW
jgi:hypothetical protein